MAGSSTRGRKRRSVEPQDADYAEAEEDVAQQQSSRKRLARGKRLKPDAEDRTSELVLIGSSPNSKSTASPKAKRLKNQKASPKKETGIKPIQSFFNKTSHQEFLAASQENLTRGDSPTDPIEDDISDGDGLDKADGVNGSFSNKRLKLSNGSASKRPIESLPSSLSSDGRPWSEKFGPANLGEIAVHKRKVSDVSDWIKSVQDGRSTKKMLVLRGPAGCGKSTTVKLLSAALSYEVLEWRNPLANKDTFGPGSSVFAQFRDFLSRAGRTGSLELSTDLNDFSRSTENPESPPVSAQKVLLVEEFPNTFARSSDALLTFKSSLLEYLVESSTSAGGPFNRKIHRAPLILVISETLLTTTSASADSFTAHRLLGYDLLNHPNTTVVDFNPIAPTFMLKALDLVIHKQSRISGRRNYPGPLVLQHLSTIGDIRNAIGSLEFLCARQGAGQEWSGQVALRKTKKSSKNAQPPTQMEKDSLELVTQREASLGIFHAVGKVVYNKREETDKASEGPRLVQPPDHLSQHFRIKASTVSLDRLIDETGTDIATFTAALHENYVLSCEHDMTEDTLESTNGCLDSLSDADIMQPFQGAGPSTRPSRFGGKFQGTTLDSLRQDEMTFHVVTRGMLFSLPNPVKRKQSGSGRSVGQNKSDAFKMFYPVSMRLWRKTEEMQSVIDAWSARIMKNPTNLLSTRKLQEASAGTVESWQKHQRHRIGDEDSESEVRTTFIPQDELVAVQLPLLSRILKGKSDGSAAHVRELRKLVNPRDPEFKTAESLEDDDENVPQIEWATDKPEGHEDRAHRKDAKKNHAAPFKFKQTQEPLANETERLVLSDDDIED